MKRILLLLLLPSLAHAQVSRAITTGAALKPRTAPTVSAGTGAIYLKSSDHRLHLIDDLGVDVSLSDTIASVYNNGQSFSDNTMFITAAQGPLFLQSAVANVGFLFDILDSVGNPILDIRDTSSGTMSIGANTTILSGKTLTIGSGGTVFNGNGRLTFPSATGANGVSTVNINGPAGYTPLTIFSSSGSSMAFMDSSTGIAINNTNMGIDFRVTNFGSTKAFVVAGDSGTAGFNKLRVEAPSSQTVSVLVSKGGATPGASAHLLDLQDSTGTSLFLVDNAGNSKSSYARNLGTAQTTGASLANTTAAANNAQQFSPMSCWEGAGWGTTGSASSAARICVQAQPTQGTTPLVEYVWFYQIGANTPVEMFRAKQDAAGVMTLVGGAASNNAKFMNGAGTGMNLGAAGFIQFLVSGTPVISFLSNAMSPSVDLSAALGTSITRYTEVWARRHAGVPQTIPAAATLTIDPASGEYVKLTLSATAINAAGISAGSGFDNETIKVVAIQDATGGRTLTQANFSSSWVFDGTYTVSSAANKRDILTFTWDSTAAKWYESAKRIQNL